MAYEIKRLEWRPLYRAEGIVVYASDATFAAYTICKIDGKWTWGYCVSEGLDNASATPCKNLKEGKLAAEAHWQERMRQGLVEVKDAH